MPAFVFCAQLCYAAFDYAFIVEGNNDKYRFKSLTNKLYAPYFSRVYNQLTVN